jgi:hypothetical protein
MPKSRASILSSPLEVDSYTNNEHQSDAGVSHSSKPNSRATANFIVDNMATTPVVISPHKEEITG